MKTGNDKLISAYEAAEYMNCTVQNVWGLIKRLSLKAVKKNGKILTTKAWIDEYYTNKRSKCLHSIYNGRKVFSREKGDLSVSMVMKDLNLSRTTVFHYINNGRLKTYRKGHYHVIRQEELERFVEQEYRGHKELTA